MKVIKRNEEQKEREEKDKLKKVQEDVRRYEYLEGLKKNRNFQKYVIEDIIDKEITESEKSSFANIDTLVKASPEEVKNIMITKSANVLLLKKIKRLLNGD